MDKKELIEYCESLKGDLNKFINGVDVNKIIKAIEQLDEPKEKVTLPRPVANWISCVRGRNKTLHFALENAPEEVNLWFCEDEKNRQNVFADAWVNGYHIEKEKRYIVKMTATKQPLFYNNMYEKTFFSLGDLATRFTCEELEKLGLGWVFDCPGIEVEEVEE
nr:MAG TPA: Protein of unknown function (DUF1642) [Caudoviricetes sp.]